MKVFENEEYLKDVAAVAKKMLPFAELDNASIMLSGATGMIGSFLIDVLLFRNIYCGANTTIYALGRSKERLLERFSYYEGSNLHFIEQDINVPIEQQFDKVDYVLHLASNTHPVAYATNPIETILTNIIGTQHMLDFAVAHQAERFLFTSSNEIYGVNRGDVELFSEDYCGYIDSNTLRAGYPESKRCGEALCQAYLEQEKLDVVVARLTRSYGPTLLSSDTKAMSQFLNNALNGENIILKSDGSQFYSYLYVADAVSGMLTILLSGETGHAYNIADEMNDITLKELATYIAKISNIEVQFAIPNELEQKGFSRATKARLDSTKIKQLGWQTDYTIHSGVKRTLELLRQIR